MRAVVQRVRRASVSVAGECVGKIERGLLLLIGIEPSDAQSDIDYIVKKCTQLRIFEDADGKMNLSAGELGYEILLISQFTLFGDAVKATAEFYCCRSSRNGDPRLRKAHRRFSHSAAHRNRYFRRGYAG